MTPLPKILLVDDHLETRQLVAIALEENGYQVISAANGEDGLARAREETPDLVLLDVMMPDRNGYEVCREMRAIPALAETPIILFTARTRPSEKWEGFEAGATDYLTKPTRPAELLHRVGAHLRLAAEKKGEELPPDDGGAPAMAEGEAPAMPGEAVAARQRLVLVMGARGGSGATLLAINLAAALANEKQPTVLVDLDDDQGHIGTYLKREHPGLEKWVGRAAVRPPLDRLLLTFTPHWQLLLWNPEANRERFQPSARELQDLLTTLLHPRRTVVVDAGHRLTSGVRALLRQADEVVYCLKPERASLTAAQQRLPYFAEWVRPPARVHCVLMDFGAGRPMARNVVESLIDHGLAATVHLVPEELTELVNNGRFHIDDLPDSPVAQSIRRLAARVVTGPGR